MSSNLHDLHLATESSRRPTPVVWRPWFLLLAVLAGFWLGVAVMLFTDAVNETNEALETYESMEIIVRPGAGE